MKKKKFWFRILNEATNINSFRFLYEATGYRKIGEIKKAQNVWGIYIKKYPTSIKNNMIEKFFKEEVRINVYISN